MQQGILSQSFSSLGTRSLAKGLASEGHSPPSGPWLDPFFLSPLLTQSPQDDSSLLSPICPQTAAPTSGYSETKTFPLGNGVPSGFQSALSWSPGPTNQPAPIELQVGPTPTRASNLDLEKRPPAIHLFQKVLPFPFTGIRGSCAMIRDSGIQKSKALSCPIPQPQAPQAPPHLYPPTPTSSKGLVTDTGRVRFASWSGAWMWAGNTTVYVSGDYRGRTNLCPPLIQLPPERH